MCGSYLSLSLGNLWKTKCGKLVLFLWHTQHLYLPERGMIVLTLEYDLPSASPHVKFHNSRLAPTIFRAI